MNRLDAIRQRVERASPGPWIDDGDFGVASLDDAHFIAHSREDLPALLAVVEAGWRVLERYIVLGPSDGDWADDMARLNAALAPLLREENAG